MHRYRIPAMLAVAFSAIVLGPALGVLPVSLFQIAVLILFFFALFAVFVRAWFDAFLFGALALGFLLSRFFFPNVDDATLLIRAASTGALLLLHAVLLIGPWSRFSDRILRLYTHRRRLGVTMFFLALIHAVLVSRLYYDYSFRNAVQAAFAFFGSVALYFLAFLAITSWDWVQKHVSRRAWGFIHAAVLLGYGFLIGAFVSVLRSSSIPLPQWMIVFFLATLLYGLAMAPWGPVARRLKVVMGWKQLHVLVYIAYAATIIHSWSGVVQYQGPLLRGAYLFLVFFVAGSHLAGWLKKFRDERFARERVLRVGKSFSDSEGHWVGIARVDEFAPGRGQRFLVFDRAVAVYRIMDRFVALSAVCAHQKGPLDRGRIDAGGYVVCPWHQWQYSTRDGQGPPGFKDCVPFYPTKVVEGVVFVREAAATQNA